MLVNHLKIMALIRRKITAYLEYLEAQHFKHTDTFI